MLKIQLPCPEARKDWAGNVSLWQEVGGQAGTSKGWQQACSEDVGRVWTKLQ